MLTLMLEDLLKHYSYCNNFFGIYIGEGCPSSLQAIFFAVLEIVAVVGVTTLTYKLIQKYRTSTTVQKLAPATGKVSVAWQAFFAIIPLLNWWAFFRIRKLRKFVLFIVVPLIISYTGLEAFLISISMQILQETMKSGTPSQTTIEPNIFVQIAVVTPFVLVILAILLMIGWSIQHNKRFGQPAIQSSGAPF